MTIICVLVKYHGIYINVKTLKRRLGQFRLQGRTQGHSEYTLQEMMQHQFQTFLWISWQKLFDHKLFLSFFKKTIFGSNNSIMILNCFLDLKNFLNYNLNYVLDLKNVLGFSSIARSIILCPEELWSLLLLNPLTPRSD